MMKILPHLLMGCCCLYLFGTSAVALAHNTITDSLSSDKNTTSSPSSQLNPEEMQYIQLECEGFAQEDNIDSEKHLAYVQICIGELSAVVQSAMQQLQMAEESQAPSVSGDRSTEN